MTRVPVKHADTEAGHAPPEHLATLAPELGVHQVLAGVHHVHGDAVALQTPRGLKTQQSAADHDGLVVIIMGRVIDHRAGVVDGPEREHAGQQIARGRYSPSIGGMNERLPVAMINWSYGVIRPSSENTTLANRSIRSTRTPACRVMPFSTYQSSELRKMSASASSPTARGSA